MNSYPTTMKFVLGAWFVMLLISLPSQAQVAGATLSGTVTDSSGGIVPNAKVSVKNVATGQLKGTESNSSGAYTVPNLIPSDYEVSVSAPGFSTAVIKVTLTVGAKQEINIPLSVGQIQQTVEVTGAVPQVELESSTLLGNIQSAEIRELPLNGRDWASLATLEPGVAQIRTHLDFTHVGAGGRGIGMQLTISGGRPTQNSYRLDGAIVNDYSNSGPGSVLGANLGVDAIQEFTVLTSNYSAEYGFTSGGVINAATRSGTNTFHGSAFEFLRNDKLDARNFFTNAKGLPKNVLRQNQFGASGGWRVLKDRAFLFGAYEGVRKVADLPQTGQVTISDAVRNGTVTNNTTGAVIAVPIDPNLQKFLPLFPHPAAGTAGCVPLAKGTFNPGGCDPNTGLFNFLGAQRATENFLTTRGDYKFSDKDSIFAVYLRDFSSITTPLTFNNDSQFITSYRQAIIAEETHVFSAAWANSLRVAEDRTVNFAGGTSPVAINPATADISLGMNTPGITSGFYAPGITITGSGVTPIGGGLNAGPSIQDFWGQIFQVYDDAFVTRGTHGLKFGFAFLAVQNNGYTPLNIYNGSGTFSYVGTFPVLSGSPRTPSAAEAPCLLPGKGAADGNNYDQSCGSLVNFLSDQPLSATRPFDALGINKQYLRSKDFGGYVQDDWRFRPNLTLNLGLRYEMSTIPTEKNGEVLIMPSPFTPLPCVTPPQCTTTNPTSVLRNSFWAHNPTLKNFEPRVGFAWDPFRNGKMAVRGGFGIFDALPLPYELSLNNTQAAPWRSTLAVPGNATQNILVSPSRGTWPYGVPAQVGNIHVNDPVSRTFYYVDANIKRNYVYQYNLNVQRQLTASTTILVGYTGSRAFHNPFQSSYNTVFPCGATPCAPGQGPTLTPGVGYGWPVVWTGSLSAAGQRARLLNPTMGAGGLNTMWQSRSWYNALQVRVNKRMSHGFQVEGSFTWAKAIDDSSGSIKGDTFQLGATGGQPWYDLRLNKGLSEFDIRRNLVINGLWQAPTARTLGAIGKRVLGGWQLGLIVAASDGVPISPGIGGDLLGEGLTTGLQPPNVAAGCSFKNLVNSDYRHTLLYINTKCLSLVPQTATNLPYCDTTRVGAGFPGFCPNIRGNLGRGTVIGPGLFTADFSVFKNNYIRKISETFNAQFRAEFFNVLNHTNFAPSGAPAISDSVFQGNGLVNPLYSLLTSTQTPNREIQFALKLVW